MKNRMAFLALVWVLRGLWPAAWADGQEPPSRAEFDRLRQEVAALRDRVGRGQEGHGEGADEEEGLKLTIGGQYRVMASANNFGFHPVTLTDRQRSQSFFNQRFRTWLSVRPTERVEGYLQVEMGHIGWGDDFEFPKTFSGPRFPAGTDPDDHRVGVEVRRAWLGYQRQGLGRFRVGIQDWQDAFGQTLASADWDFNVGGIDFVRTCEGLGGARVRAGGFVLWEGDPSKADDALLFTLDVDCPLEEKQGLGFSLYFVDDHGVYSYPLLKSYDSSWDVWAGVRGNTLLGALPLNAFFLVNAGKRDDGGGLPDFRHRGYAAKVEVGGQRLGPGALSVQALYASGEDDPKDRSSRSFRTIAQSVRDGFGAQGYWSYLALTSPHGPSDVSDLGVGLQNRGLGLMTVQAKYAYPLVEDLSGTAAAGWLRAAAKNPANRERDMGVELAHTLTLDLGGGLLVDFGGAYLFTGDFYQASGPAAADPDNLWLLFTRVQLEF